MEKQNKRLVGAEKEALAETYLTEHGLQILEKNYYFKGGELDLIAKDGEVLCFVEVKYRKTAALGFPEEAVTPAKQQKIRFGARQYLYMHGLSEYTPCRFDVVAILGNDINWIEDAF